MSGPIRPSPPASPRYRNLGDAADQCCSHLATLMATLEGIGDEELYEWALQAYEAASWLRRRLTSTGT